jgi:hypothetical protein
MHLSRPGQRGCRVLGRTMLYRVTREDAPAA